mmetsp:Transcript_2003/g.4484  ORF Transcript_2003/g.4484 Transcript_2003/m.4484 type:complete len:205 (+) Transcript_2003:730-1344(+)
MIALGRSDGQRVGGRRDVRSCSLVLASTFQPGLLRIMPHRLQAMPTVSNRMIGASRQPLSNVVPSVSQLLYALGDDSVLSTGPTDTLRLLLLHRQWDAPLDLLHHTLSPSITSTLLFGCSAPMVLFYLATLGAVVRHAAASLARLPEGRARSFRFPEPIPPVADRVIGSTWQHCSDLSPAAAITAHAIHNHLVFYRRPLLAIAM